MIQLPKAKDIPCNDPTRRQSLAPYPARTELRCSLKELGNIKLVSWSYDLVATSKNSRKKPPGTTNMWRGLVAPWLDY